MDQFEYEETSKSYNLMDEELIQIQKATTPDQESLLVLFDEIEILEEQINYWRDLDAQKTHELQALEQELLETNQELLKAVVFQNTSFAQIKELAKTLVATEKSASECLAELMSKIYGFPVNSQELGVNVKLPNPAKLSIIPDNSRVINESRELINKLKIRLQALKTDFAILKEIYNQMSAETALQLKRTNVLKQPTA